MKRQLSKAMPYPDLIAEHEGLVRILARAIKSGRMSGIKRLHKDQLKELREYKEDYQKAKRRRR